MQTRRVNDIEYQLLPGTARHTTDIVIERDGRISVRPPARLLSTITDLDGLGGGFDQAERWTVGNLPQRP